MSIIKDLFRFSPTFRWGAFFLLIVLALVAKGWRNARIAGELVISVRTVEAHLTNIFGKLGVSSRTEAALYFLQTRTVSNSEIRVISEDVQSTNAYAGT